MTQQYITEEGQNFQTLPQMPQRKPKVPLTKRKWFLPVLLGAVLLIGFGTGAAKPPQTVEVTKEVPVEKIVEKEVEVPTTPKACTDALDYASIIFTMNADAIGIMNDMVQHAGRLNAAGLQDDTARLEKATADLGKVKQPYADAVSECRAG